MAVGGAPALSVDVSTAVWLTTAESMAHVALSQVIFGVARSGHTGKTRNSGCQLSGRYSDPLGLHDQTWLLRATTKIVVVVESTDVWVS
jgi:hypothetical protein